MVDWLLSLLLGGMGVDRFCLGKVGTGIPKPLSSAAADGSSFTVTVSEGNTVKVVVTDGNEAVLIYLEEGLDCLPTEEVAAGDARQGVVVFDVKTGPTTIVVNDDYGDQASTFSLTTQ